MNKNPLEAILGIFNKLSIQQKILVGGTAALSILVIGILFFFLNSPSYTTLFTNLSEDDASKAIEYLSAEKIPYKIEDNGKTIKVSKEILYETRLGLAAKGIPGTGVVGYEIFDSNTMGMSEFMQKLNYKRALEGELARTIMQQEGVAGVRVHIVLPQKSIFKNEEKLPTASVVLKLNGNYSPDKSNILAIVNLVSSSVEGLLANKVTVLDTRGQLLTNNSGDDATFGSTRQYEVKQSVENYLAAKAQMLLDNVLGFGNAIVQVNADINFDQVEKTMEFYDPETQVAVSEQTIKTENNGTTLSDSTAQLSENTTTNYEISKTIQHVIEGSGNIKKLTVAAVINDIIKEEKRGEKTEKVIEPRTTEQMQKLEEIIKNAVGIDPQRQDQVSIVNISFEPPVDEIVETDERPFWEDTDKWINFLIIAAAIAAAFFVLKGLMNKIKNEKIIIGTFNPEEISYNASVPALTGGNVKQIPNRQRKGLLPVGDIEDEISDEAAYKKNRQEKIVNYVSKNPIEAAKLINAWLHDEDN